MKRGDLYRVPHPSHDPKKYRVFAVISRQAVIDSRFSTVICAPIYTIHDGLASQVAVGIEEGLKHESSTHCDELVSLPKTVLTNYIGMLSLRKVEELNYALRVAIDLTD
ncbi:MAG: type II toxin-antitoxin system PemK/MazF family toxin [Dehalococcoidia bacterium]